MSGGEGGIPVPLIEASHGGERFLPDPTDNSMRTMRLAAAIAAGATMAVGALAVMVAASQVRADRGLAGV